MNPNKIKAAHVQTAYDNWNDTGLNKRGEKQAVDPEVLHDIGYHLPEDLPDVIADVLERHNGVATLETESGDSSQAERAQRSNGRPKPVDPATLDAHEKRRRDDERHRKPAPYGTADPIILNDPDAIGLASNTPQENGHAKVFPASRPPEPERPRVDVEDIFDRPFDDEG